MQNVLKKAMLKKTLKNVDSGVSLKFSNRGKRLLGTANMLTRSITLYKPLFAKTLDSCLHCLFHELAHIFQYEMSGRMGHDKQFVEIKDMLIEDYGTLAIAKSNHSTKASLSQYDIDSNSDGAKL